MLDARIGYRVIDRATFPVSAQNFTQAGAHHQDAGTTVSTPGISQNA